LEKQMVLALLEAACAVMDAINEHLRAMHERARLDNDTQGG